MLKEQGGGSGWGGEGETQTWAETLEGAAGPQPRREPLPTGPRPPAWCPRLVPGQHSPEDTLAQWHHEKHVSTTQGASHLFQQAYIKSIVQRGKWGSERLSKSPEITQPGCGRAQTGTQVCRIPKLVISNCPAPLPASRILFATPPTPKDAHWWCFPGRRALTLDGKGLAPQPSPPGPQKPTAPALHPGQTYPLPHPPWGSLCDGC